MKRPALTVPVVLALMVYVCDVHFVISYLLPTKPAVAVDAPPKKTTADVKLNGKESAPKEGEGLVGGLKRLEYVCLLLSDKARAKYKTYI